MHRIALLLFCAGLPALFAEEKTPALDPKVPETAVSETALSEPAPRRGVVPGWLRLSAGVSHRRIDRVAIRGGSRSSSADLPRLGRSSISPVPGRVGAANAFDNRQYDNGFVNIDPGTGNPRSQIPDSTWFWGYDTPSQVDGQVLTFNARGGLDTRFGRQSSGGDAPMLDEDADDTSFFLQVEPFLLEIGAVRLNLQGAWSVFETSARTAESRTFSERQVLDTFQTSITDVYVTGLDFSLAPLNSTPYAGDFTGPGPLIPNIPTRRNIDRRPVGRQTLQAFNRVRDSIDVETHALSLGLSAERRVGRLLLGGAAGGALHFVDIETRHVETLSVARNGGAPVVVRRWNERESDSETEPGFYLQATAGLYVTRRISINLIGRWDWVDEITGGFGPSGYAVDLSGYALIGAIGIDL